MGAFEGLRGEVLFTKVASRHGMATAYIFVAMGDRLIMVRRCLVTKGGCRVVHAGGRMWLSL